MDISKKDVKLCVRIAGTGRRKATETVTTWSSMTAHILALREHLATENVTCVVMEATGDTRLRHERARQRAVHQLEAMGCRVTLDEAS